MLLIVFTEKAEIDLQEIGDWYSGIRKGLDLDFLVCVEAELELIRKLPLINKEYYLKVRKAIINRFPYGIYYSIEEKQITILAIAHHRRGQKAIKKKLKKK